MPVIKKKPKLACLSLSKYWEKRNQILIYRSYGGLGDILMHRMIFEDFKKINPDMKIAFACPEQYHEAVSDHPYIDDVLDSKTVNLDDYPCVYDTSSACCRYETGMAPYSGKHRSDIWANHCGVKLENHNMHLKFSEEELEYGRMELKKIGWNGEPTVAFCTISAMKSKNLNANQVIPVVEQLKAEKYFVFSLHNSPIDYFVNLNVPVLIGKTIRQWMCILAAADFVISVDSSPFHFVGGIGKPVTGIFTWADGYVYGMYYKTAKIVQFHRNTHPHWTCGPCYLFSNCPLSKEGQKPCLTQITGEMIWNTVKKMLIKK